MKFQHAAESESARGDQVGIPVLVEIRRGQSQWDERRGVYPAVHSRHFGLFGEPLIAQYTGTCTAR